MVGPDIESSNKGGDGDGLRQLENADHRSSAGFSEPDHGPNLVFALLMDGPQLRDRWPGRYAMTLADDPGSSVLSLTSLGLMRRSSYLFRSRECVALWRDSQGETNEIEIPAGAHGLLISLSRETHEEFTLDGRGDGGSAYSWTLTGSTSVVNSHCKLDE